jgi:hypothetical protein
MTKRKSRKTPVKPGGGQPSADSASARTDRDRQTGRFTPGNTAHLKLGLRARPENLPPELARIHEQAQVWTEQLRRDQGGPDLTAAHDGAVNNLGVLEYSMQLLVHDLRVRGLHTAGEGCVVVERAAANFNSRRGNSLPFGRRVQGR